jgi:hypothetical protein
MRLGTFEDLTGGFAIDSTNIYWTNFASSPYGAIWEAPLDGGPSVILASGQATPNGIVVQDSVLYWSNSGSSEGSDDGSIEMLPLDDASADGGGIINLAVNQAYPSLLAVAGDRICWTTSSTLSCRPIAGSGPEFAVSLAGQPLSLAVNQNSVYWATASRSMAESRLRSRPAWANREASPSTPSSCTGPTWSAGTFSWPRSMGEP